MAKLITDQKAFATEQEAQEFASDYRHDMWGYDPSTQVYQQGDQWIVVMRRYDSCD